MLQKILLVLMLLIVGACSSPRVPEGAQFSKEHIHYFGSQELADKGFDHLLAWMTVVTTTSTGEHPNSKIVIKSLKIIEKSVWGSERVVQEMDYGTADPVILTGMLFKRLPYWYTSGQAQITNAVDSEDGNIYTVDMSQAAPYIWHAYTQPRIPAQPTSRYLIEATLLISGDARIQFGMDYWKGMNSPYSGWSEGCKTSNNCEAWLSDWYQDTDGKFVTIRTPQTFLQ